jgi:excisionase family DNA binding protein
MYTSLPDDVAHLSWACEQLDIGLRTGYRLAKAGKIPGAFQIGTQWRVSKPAFCAAVHSTVS